jgi:hypothetical protein
MSFTDRPYRCFHQMIDCSLGECVPLARLDPASISLSSVTLVDSDCLRLTPLDSA